MISRQLMRQPDDEALTDFAEHYQKQGKTAYPLAKALIFVQISPTTGMSVAWGL